MRTNEHLRARLVQPKPPRRPAFLARRAGFDEGVIIQSEVPGEPKARRSSSLLLMRAPNGRADAAQNWSKEQRQRHSSRQPNNEGSGGSLGSPLFGTSLLSERQLALRMHRAVQRSNSESQPSSHWLVSMGSARNIVEHSSRWASASWQSSVDDDDPHASSSRCVSAS